MILPYALRLVVLCAATFFLVHLLLALMTWAAAPVAIRWAQGMKAQSAARFLLLVRFSAVGFALLLTAAVCVPSYLRFEPQEYMEPVGFACLAAAFLALVSCAMAFWRTLRAVGSSVRYVRGSRRAAVAADECAGALVIEGTTPRLLVAGIFRARLIVSSRVLSLLAPEELEAVLRHERMHCVSRDNLKRLLMLMAPGILPFFRGFDSVERAWARCAEWAADDGASAGDAKCALALAEALIRFARAGNAAMPSPLFTSLLADDSDLAVRVERLLNKTPATELSDHAGLSRVGVATGVLFAAALALVVHDPTLLVVHSMLERLVH